MSKATFDPTRYSPDHAPCFQTVLSQRLARRSFIQRGAALAALSALPAGAFAGAPQP